MQQLLLPILLLSLTAAGAAQTAPWSYEGKEGPLRWGRLDPAYRACGEGKEQAPIDIRGAKLNKTLTPIEFHYLAAPVRLENDGHTVVVRVRPGSYMVANGERYNLEQIDFHHPSEEAVSGKVVALGAHLIHRSAAGKVAVVAVRMIEDRDQGNATLAALWPQLPAKSGSSSEVNERINPLGLLPADRAYWTYMGSMTTPPCAEGVRWFVLAQETSVGRDQARYFASLFRLNSRPLQEPHGRKIEANQ